MGVGVGYNERKRWRMEQGIYHTASDPDWQPTESEVKLPNPDPANYNIIRVEQINNYLILEIRYPDCNNYEGKKILVFKDVTPIDLLNQRLIDPHFSNSKNMKSPVARFVPTDEGWSMALHLCRSYGEK